MPSQTSSRLYISQHVHFVCEDQYAVFLNLHSDQYSMLLGEKARMFRALLAPSSNQIQELVVPDFGDSRNVAQGLCKELISELLSNDLLTRKEHEAASNRVEIPLPEDDLLNLEEAEEFALGLVDICRFVISCTSTFLRLKFQSIEGTVNYLQRRKRLRRAHATPFVLQDLRRLSYAYTRLRPFFPRDSVCLFDSVSLLEFLAHYGIYPDMVFSVKLEPWSAHCWVQYGAIALNQDFHEARGYLPIMVI